MKNQLEREGLFFILILGVALGDSFGQKPDDRLRISVVLEDTGVPQGDESPPGITTGRWADLILRDLQQTAGVKVEVIPDRATADQLIRGSERSTMSSRSASGGRVIGPYQSVKTIIARKINVAKAEMNDPTDET